MTPPTKSDCPRSFPLAILALTGAVLTGCTTGSLGTSQPMNEVPAPVTLAAYTREWSDKPDVQLHQACLQATHRLATYLHTSTMALKETDRTKFPRRWPSPVKKEIQRLRQHQEAICQVDLTRQLHTWQQLYASGDEEALAAARKRLDSNEQYQRLQQNEADPVLSAVNLEERKQLQAVRRHMWVIEQSPQPSHRGIEAPRSNP